MLQLADEYLGLLHDETKAAAILIQGYKLDPAFADISDRLKSLGYERLGNSWVKGATAKPAPVPIPAGGTNPIAIGMTATQASVAMSVRPGSITRIVSKQGVAEIWCYYLGASRLVVHLERTGIATEPVVIDIKNE